MSGPKGRLGSENSVRRKHGLKEDSDLNGTVESSMMKFCAVHVL